MADDRCLTDDPHEHGPKTQDLLRDRVFPELHGEHQMDDVIEKCWRCQYATVEELAAHTERLLAEETAKQTIKEGINVEASHNEPAEGDSWDDMHHDPLTGGSYSKKEYCQDLENRGLLDIHSSGKPKELGFIFDWSKVLLMDD